MKVLTQLTIPAIGLGIALGFATPHTTSHSVAAHRQTADRVDACLRAHGWPYGLLGLEGAEIRAHHPNGLVRICGAAESPD